jgi:hypothetical protein
MALRCRGARLPPQPPGRPTAVVLAADRWLPPSGAAPQIDCRRRCPRTLFAGSAVPRPGSVSSLPSSNRACSSPAPGFPRPFTAPLSALPSTTSRFPTVDTPRAPGRASPSGGPTGAPAKPRHNILYAGVLLGWQENRRRDRWESAPVQGFWMVALPPFLPRRVQAGGNHHMARFALDDPNGPSHHRY